MIEGNVLFQRVKDWKWQYSFLGMETSLADAAPDGDMERVNYLINKVRYEKGQCGYFGDAFAGSGINST